VELGDFSIFLCADYENRLNILVSFCCFENISSAMIVLATAYLGQ
jgi:hypothetical protein